MGRGGGQDSVEMTARDDILHVGKYCSDRLVSGERKRGKMLREPTWKLWSLRIGEEEPHDRFRSH
jgi:hypothetical protein